MRDEIIAVDRVWEDAIIAVDVRTLNRLAADEMVYTHAGCDVDDKSAFIDHIVNGALRFTRIDYEDVAVRTVGPTAVLTCALHLETVDRCQVAGGLHFRTTHVWICRDERWQLLANQSTHLPATTEERRHAAGEP